MQMVSVRTLPMLNKSADAHADVPLQMRTVTVIGSTISSQSPMQKASMTLAGLFGKGCSIYQTHMPWQYGWQRCAEGNILHSNNCAMIATASR